MQHRWLALPVAVLIAAPLAARAAALSLTSQHLTTLSTCELIGFPPTSGVGIDTFADQNGPTTINGTAPTIDVQSSATKNQRGYLRFDLTKCIFAPPPTAIVRAAWLALFVTKLPSVCRTYDVFSLGATWSETTLTWSNQPNPPGTTINNPPSAQRTSSSAIGNVSSCANHTNNQYVGWDVTTDVAKYVAGTSTNNGWMIRDDVEDSATAQQSSYVSIDANHNNQAPQLMISYTLV